MIPPLSPETARALLAARVDPAWLEQLEREPDGRALLTAIVDTYVAVDQANAQQASALYLQPHSRQVAPPASGPAYATTTIAVTLRRALRTTRPMCLPAGSPVQTPDGHVFLTTDALFWGLGQVGLTQQVVALAAVPGSFAIPPHEITQFVEVGRGLSGRSTQVSLLPALPAQPRALRLRTSLTEPHPFTPALVGRYIELITPSSGGSANNHERALQIGSVNDGTDVSAPAGPENEYAWGQPADTSVDAWALPWSTGNFAADWRLVDWNELFSVENVTAVEGGALPMLDEIGQGRGRPRQPLEGDEPYRARLAQRSPLASPLRQLRAVVAALVPFGFGLEHVRIYEMGLPAADIGDPYAAQFPAGLGFVSDLHTTDMASPETPDGMASRAPNGTALSAYVTPGLALVLADEMRADIVVRWDPPPGMFTNVIAQIRRLLVAAARAARPAGAIVQLYHPPAWSY